MVDDEIESWIQQNHTSKGKLIWGLCLTIVFILFYVFAPLFMSERAMEKGEFYAIMAIVFSLASLIDAWRKNILVNEATELFLKQKNAPNKVIEIGTAFGGPSS